MKKSFEMFLFIKQLVSIHHRQLKNETKAANLILKILDEYKVPYKKHFFPTEIPDFKSSKLVVDGKIIPSTPTSFISGKIHGKDNIISSFISQEHIHTESNINFNPHCHGISRANHYFVPSLAVGADDIPKIVNAKRVEGEVKVIRTKHKSLNILVGNIKNPKTVLFCHYDSFGPGAIDNASGTAILMKLAINHPETYSDTLYVIGGNEELSYDKPTFWGRGYRMFEKKYFEVLKDAKQIFVVDSLGNGKTVINQDSELLFLGFPIKNLNQWIHKTYMVYGDIYDLFSVYHSEFDTVEKVRPEYLEDATRKLLKRIKS